MLPLLKRFKKTPTPATETVTPTPDSAVPAADTAHANKIDDDFGYSRRSGLQSHQLELMHYTDQKLQGFLSTALYEKLEGYLQKPEAGEILSALQSIGKWQPQRDKYGAQLPMDDGYKEQYSNDVRAILQQLGHQMTALLGGQKHPDLKILGQIESMASEQGKTAPQLLAEYDTLSPDTQEALNRATHDRSAGVESRTDLIQQVTEFRELKTIMASLKSEAAAALGEERMKPTHLHWNLVVKESHTHIPSALSEQRPGHRASLSHPNRHVPNGNRQNGNQPTTCDDTRGR